MRAQHVLSYQLISVPGGPAFEERFDDPETAAIIFPKYYQKGNLSEKKYTVHRHEYSCTPNIV